MSATVPEDIALLLFRLAPGVMFLAHGYNHVFGDGKIAGTGHWFESLGMRPGWLHAWTASLTELGAGVLLVLALRWHSPARVFGGTMTVAWSVNRRFSGDVRRVF
jgi:putative oxidoreductase